MQLELWKTLAAMAPVISQRPLKVQRYIVQPAYILPMPLLAKNQSNLEVSKGDTIELYFDDVTKYPVEITAIAENYKTELDELPNVQGVTELADSSVVIRTTFTAWNWQQLVIERALRQAIKEELDKAGVEISYPKVQLMQ